MCLHSLLSLNTVPNIFRKDQSKHLRWARIENWSRVRLLFRRFEKAIAEIHQGSLLIDPYFFPFPFCCFTQDHGVDVEGDRTTECPKGLKEFFFDVTDKINVQNRGMNFKSFKDLLEKNYLSN